MSTVGRDEAVIRDNIREQETEDKRLDKINLWRYLATVPLAPNCRAALATPLSRFERLTT